jgi:Flp pilus assembly protein TadD
VAIADASEAGRPLRDRPEQLVELIEDALSTDPDNCDLLVRRARLLGDHGSPARAIEAWRAVVAREPDVALWHRELGDRLAQAGDFEAAGVAYDRAVALGFNVY